MQTVKFDNEPLRFFARTLNILCELCAFVVSGETPWSASVSNVLPVKL
jgi:hypothetical protein